MTLITAGIYLVAMFAFGLWHRRPKDAEDYFLAGRSTGAVFLTGSIIATVFGAFGVMGIAGLAYNMGLVAGWYHWVGTIGLLILGFWALPRVSMQDVYTLPEMIGRGYGPLVRSLSGILIVIAWLYIVSAQFTAGGKIVRFLIESHPGMGMIATVPAEAWAILVGLVVIVYTAIGGQRSVIRTDLIQAILIFAGVTTLFIALLFRAGNPMGQINAESWQFPFNKAMPPLKWVDLLLTLGVPFLVGPDIYSRVLSGRDVATGRRAVVAAALIMIPLVLMIVLCGMMGKVVYPDGVDDRERILLMLAFDHMHPLISGLMVAALLAAIMSSADTCLVTVSTILTRDVLPRGFGASSDRALPVGRGLILVAGCLSLLLSSAFGSIVAALYSAYQIYSPSFLVPFLALICLPKHRFSRRTGVFAVALGAGTASLSILKELHWLQLLAYAMPALPLALDLIKSKPGEHAAPPV